MTYDLKRHCLRAIEEMKSAANASFREGFSKAQLKACEDAIACKLPPEIAALLRVSVPVQNTWPDWHGPAEELVSKSRAFIEFVFQDAIEKDVVVWLPSRWGEPPIDGKGAVAKALTDIRTLPPLIPLYAIRHMPSSPSGAGNPVYSIYCPYDAIVYGEDFPDYLHEEFGVTMPEGHVLRFRPAFIWHNVLTENS